MDPDEQLKPIAFSIAERDLILSLSSLDDESEQRFRLAVMQGSKVVVQMNAYDLDELHGIISAVSNHTENRKLRKQLDAITDHLIEVLESEFPKQNG